MLKYRRQGVLGLQQIYAVDFTLYSGDVFRK